MQALQPFRCAPDFQVILTLVSNNPNQLGFFEDTRRQCVALSRAKRTMTIVTNLQVAASVPALASFCQAAGVKLPTCEYTEENGWEYEEEDWDEGEEYEEEDWEGEGSQRGRIQAGNDLRNLLQRKREEQEARAKEETAVAEEPPRVAESEAKFKKAARHWLTQFNAQTLKLGTLEEKLEKALEGELKFRKAARHWKTKYEHERQPKSDLEQKLNSVQFSELKFRNAARHWKTKYEHEKTELEALKAELEALKASALALSAPTVSIEGCPPQQSRSQRAQPMTQQQPKTTPQQIQPVVVNEVHASGTKKLTQQDHQQTKDMPQQKESIVNEVRASGTKKRARQDDQSITSQGRGNARQDDVQTGPSTAQHVCCQAAINILRQRGEPMPLASFGVELYSTLPNARQLVGGKLKQWLQKQPNCFDLDVEACGGSGQVSLRKLCRNFSSASACKHGSLCTFLHG